MPVRDGGSYRLQKDGKLRTLKGPSKPQRYGAHDRHPAAPEQQTQQAVTDQDTETQQQDKEATDGR